MNIIDLSNSYEKGEISKPDFIKQMYNFHQILFDYSVYLNGTNIGSIEISENRVLMTDRQFGIKIICPPQDLRVLPIETLNFKNYEENELQLVLNLLEDKSVILDIGANIGWYSLVMGKKFPNSKIYAFEPLQDIFNYLASHIDINKISNITAVNLGVSDKSGESSFYVDPNNSVNASILNIANAKSTQKIHITLTTIDEFVASNNLKKVDFIKCDVEGAEFNVFKGALKTLKEHHPTILCEMVRKWTAPYNYHPNDIISYLKEYGYACFAIGKDGITLIAQMDEGTAETNFLFILESKAKKLGILNGFA